METRILRRIVRRASPIAIGLAGAIALHASVSQAQTVIQITNYDGTVLPASASLYTTYRHCAPSGPVTVCDWYLRKLYGDNSAVAQYPSFSPFGINGAYYYGKVTFKF